MSIPASGASLSYINNTLTITFDEPASISQAAQVNTAFAGVITDSVNNRFVLPDGNRLLYPSNRVRQQPLSGSGSVVTFGASLQRTTLTGAVGFAIYTDGQVNSSTFQNGYVALFGPDAVVHIYQIINGNWHIVSNPSYSQPYPLDLHEHNFTVAIVSPQSNELQIFVYSDTQVYAAANLTPPFVINGTMGFSSIQGNGEVFITPDSISYTTGQALSQVVSSTVLSEITTIEGNFDSSGVLMASGIDFKKYTYQNQVLDYIYDGMTYQRMPTSNMDSNRRALIDLSQTGHLNKILDNIGDGTSYQRVKATELASGGIIRLNDGTNIRTATQLSSAINVSGRPIYTDGTIVDNLRPAALGADVTANNTARDTSNVNGVGASTISQGAGRANTAIDASNIIVSGSVDFSRAYSNKVLDNIGDGTTYSRVKTTEISSGSIFRLNDGINIRTASQVGGILSSSGLLIVNPSAGVTGNLPLLNHDTTVQTGSSRANATIDSSNIVIAGGIDFSRAYSNKVLDNIGDGSTYARVKTTEITSGTITRLNDGTNIRTASQLGGILSASGLLIVNPSAGVSGNLPLLNHDTTVQTGSSRANAAIDSGNIIVSGGIDFSRSYTNKILDNIADGTNYARIKTTEITSGTITRLNDGVNIRTASQLGGILSASGLLIVNPAAGVSGNLPLVNHDTTVQTGSSRANAAIDSSNIVVASGIDFTRSYSNKILDNIGDGSTYARVKTTEIVSGTVSRLNDGTNIRTAAQIGGVITSSGLLNASPSAGVTGNLPLPNHASQITATIASTSGSDGSYLNSLTISNRHFTTSATLDGIYEGTTYQRVRATEITSGTISRLNDGTNIRTAAQVGGVVNASGLLIVNPSAGVTGLLPYANHPAQITSTIASSTGSDGSYLSSSVISNRHFTTGATLDGIYDGTTYQRIKATEITSGTISRLNDGTNIRTASQIGGILSSSGLLIVNPGAGVSGNLPLLNHDTTVQTGASRANTAIDSSNIITTTSIDFSRSYTNKTLDNINEGTTYQRVRATEITSGTISRLNDGINVRTASQVGGILSASGLLIVNPVAGVSGLLPYSNHPAQFTSTIASSSGTEGSYLNSSTISNRHFTTSATLDGIYEGTTYQRVRATEINAGTIARLNDGTNIRTASQIGGILSSSGLLIVNPAAGVTGNLPLSNHASQITSTINSSTGTDGSYLVSSVISNRHFTTSATLDGIYDGSTYQRVKTTEISSGFVTRLNDGINIRTAAQVGGILSSSGLLIVNPSAGVSGNLPLLNHDTTVQTGASRANTAIDSGNVVVTSSIDFSRSYSNKNLDNIADGPTTYSRVKTTEIVSGTVSRINDGTHIRTAAQLSTAIGASGNALYADGTTVDQLRPAALGADVTANNTAHDTSNVNGIIATTISQGAGRANSAIDSSNIIVSGSVDFSRAYANKILDNINDSSNYAKVKAAEVVSGTIFRLNDGTNIRTASQVGGILSASGLLIVNPSAGVSGNLPLLNHDSTVQTGASRANTAIDSGNVVVSSSVDFSRSYTNKNLDNISDGPATYSRVKTTEIVSGTISRLNDGTNIRTASQLGGILSASGLLVVNPAAGVAGNLPLANHASQITSTINSVTGTEGSYLASSTISNRHFTTSATQDGIYDGSTYARVKVTEITSGTISRLNDGINIRTASQVGGILSSSGLLIVNPAAGVSGNLPLLNHDTTVQTGASRANTAIDSGNIITTTSIDFSRSYTNKTLDNINNGTTYQRVLATEITSGTISRLNDGTNIRTASQIGGIVSVSGLLIVNPSAGVSGNLPLTNHASQITATIASVTGSDGSYLNSSTVSNRHFTTGATLDGIYEGTTYQRVKATELTSGQVNRLNDGTNIRTASQLSNAVSSSGRPIYSDGTTVDLLRPAALGADVTANNTAHDTSNVNGVGATTISQGAGRANSAIDSSNIIVSGSVDFSRAYSNKILDNISDGTTYSRVKNTEITTGTISRLNDGTNIRTASQVGGILSASGLLIVNPSAGVSGNLPLLNHDTTVQTGASRANSAIDSSNIIVASGIDFSRSYSNKILDNISDGTTYYRMAATNMDSNRRALIDFSQTHINKILDNVPDGTTYARVKTTEITSGTISRLNDGTNIRTASQVGGILSASGLLIVNPSAGVSGNLPLVNHDTTVQTGSSRANAAIDSGNVVVAGGIDFSRSYANKILDNISDGSTYARVKTTEISSGTISRLNDGTNIRTAAQVGGILSASGLLIVNPGAGVSGNLPLVNHDTTVQSGSSRANAAIDSGNIIVSGGIDFSRAYSNKILDNIGDGSTYARIKTTEIISGAISRLNDGTNIRTASQLSTAVNVSGRPIYSDGTIVDSLRPAASGADVTANNTAHDTSNVNGVIATTISQGAGRANTAIDASNIVVSGSVDFSRAYSNKILDNIGDGSSYARIKTTEIVSGTISRLNDGTNIRTAAQVGGILSSSGLLIVNPTAGVTGNLPLANHDSTVQTGASRANTAIDASNIIVSGGIDFSRAYSNKILDNISDGSTYARVKTTEVTTGTISRLNDGTNIRTASQLGGILSSSGLLVVNPVAGVTGTLPQANHDPTVLLSSTGFQSNLVPDPNLAFGSSYWTFSGSNLSILQGAGPDGQGIIKVTPATTYVIYSSVFPVSPGNTYTFSYYSSGVGTATGDGFGMFILDGVAGFGNQLYAANNSAAPHAWTRVTSSFTIPSTGSTSIQMAFNSNGNTLTSGYLGLACFQVEHGSLATAYKFGPIISPSVGTLALAAHAPSVQTGASRANTAIDSGNVIITSSIDFSRSYTNKTLDNINEGTTYSRVRATEITSGTISRLNDGTNIRTASQLGGILSASGLLVVNPAAGVSGNLPLLNHDTTVQTGASRANTAIDSSNIITTTSIDFSRSYTNKILDNINEGTTYQRVRATEITSGTINRLNDGTNIRTASQVGGILSASGLLIVNPSAGVSGNLPLLNHDSTVQTGASRANTAIDSSNIITTTSIDFSRSYTNKTLDNINEGTTYQRVKATEITSGTISRLNDGTNIRTAAQIGGVVTSSGLLNASPSAGVTGTLPYVNHATAFTTNFDSSGNSQIVELVNTHVAAPGTTYAGRLVCSGYGLWEAAGGKHSAPLSISSTASSVSGGTVTFGIMFLANSHVTGYDPTTGYLVQAYSYSVRIFRFSGAYTLVASVSTTGDMTDGYLHTLQANAYLSSGSLVIDAFFDETHVQYVDTSPLATTGYVGLRCDGTVYVTSIEFAGGRTPIDFTLGTHVGKILDNIGDGTTYQRMPISNMDTNRRGLIDFTQTGHLSKTIDNIGDGTTYQRVKATEITSGTISRLNDGTNIRTASQIGGILSVSGLLIVNPSAGVSGNLPLINHDTTVQTGASRANTAIDSGNIVVTTSIDFSRSYTNKILDNISDGSTYARVKTTEITSGQVSRLNDGTNIRTASQLGGILSASGLLIVNPSAGVTGNLPLLNHDTTVQTGASRANTAIDSSNIITTTSIDFSRSYTNKILDNINDGSTYARVKTTEITSGTISRLNDGTNIRTASQIGGVINSSGLLVVNPSAGVTGNLPLTNHDLTIQNRDGIHISVAGAPPYIDSSNVIHFPNVIIIFRGGNGGSAQFTRVSSGTTVSLSTGSFGSVFIAWNQAGYSTPFFVAYNASGAAGTGYNTTIQSTNYEVIAHVTGDTTPCSISLLGNNSSHLYALSTTHTAQPNIDGSYIASQVITDRHIVSSIPRKNLIVNGNNCGGTGAISPAGFGWTGQFNTTATPFSGGAYPTTGGYTTIQFTKTSTASQQGYYQDIPVTPGQTYTFQSLLFATTGTMAPTIWIGNAGYSTQYNATVSSPVNASLFPKFYNTGEASNNSYTCNSNNNWIFCYGTFTVPSNAITARVLLYDASSIASQSFYACGIMVTEGSRLQDYIDHEGNVGSITNRHFSITATQDGINDGSTYARVKTTEITSGTISRLNDGTNIRTAAQVGGVITSGGLLNASPSAGVTGLLPYANHPAQITSTISSTTGSDGSYINSGIIYDRHINTNIPRKNLIVNGNNCGGTGATSPATFGWTGLFNTTATPVSAGSYGSFTSIQLVKTASANAQGYYQDVPVVPGQTYTYQTLVYAGASGMVPSIFIGNAALNIQYNATISIPFNIATYPSFYTGAYAHQNQYAVTGGIITQWVHLYGTFTIPSGVITARVLIYDTTTVVSQPFYAQGIMLTEGNRLQDYIDHEGNAGSIANRHFSLSATQDGLTDGAYYRRPYNLPHQGNNFLENPYFSIGALAPTTEVVANWLCTPTGNISYNGGGPWTTSQEMSTNGTALIGNADIFCRFNTGVTVPGSGTLYSNRITSERVTGVRIGDTYIGNFYYSVTSSTSLPAGVQLNLHFGFYRYYSDGTNDTGATAVGVTTLAATNTNTTGYQQVQSIYTIPQPTGKTITGIVVTIEMEIQNNNSTSFSTGATLYADVRLGYAQLFRATNLASEVVGVLPYTSNSSIVAATISSGGIFSGINTVTLPVYASSSAYSTINSSSTIFTQTTTIPGTSGQLYNLEVDWNTPGKYAQTSIGVTSSTSGVWNSIVSITGGLNTNAATQNCFAQYMAYNVPGGSSITVTGTASLSNNTGANVSTGLYKIRTYRYS